MGIDAEMFVRVRGRDLWLTEEQVLLKAYELGSTVGHEKFMIFRPADKFQMDGGARHCLTIIAPHEAEYDDYPELKGRTVMFQDGPPVVADDDEQFLRVHLWTRYYGDGYERGDWMTIRSTAEWCEANLPGDVWYGGDSSGVELRPLDEAARTKLNEHFLRNGHRPYEAYFGRGEKAPPCTLCRVPLFHAGGGGGPTGSPGSYSLFRCAGCGQQAVQSSSRIEWYGPQEQNAMGRFNGSVPAQSS